MAESWLGYMWLALCGEIGVKRAQLAVFGELMRLYGEKHRFYHTAEHIAECLKEFERARTISENPNEVEMAIWFHDAVYDTHRTDNEEKSAEFAINCFDRMGISRAFAKNVQRLIMATKHDILPEDIDAKVLVDVDLARLGKSEQEFEMHSQNIRKEYRHVPEEIFQKRRKSILQGFLDRPSIYLTEYFRAKFEKQARKNLAGAIAKLS